MIHPRKIDKDEIASHYNELDQFYREVWGTHVHHGYFQNGSESIEAATEALIDQMSSRLLIKSESQLCDIGAVTVKQLAFSIVNSDASSPACQSLISSSHMLNKIK